MARTGHASADGGIAGNGKAVLGAPLPSLGSIKIRVSVRVGTAHISLADLLKMQQGGVWALDQPIDEPIDVLVDDLVVARGALVAVGDHFGVRIIETAIATLPAMKG